LKKGMHMPETEILGLAKSVIDANLKSLELLYDYTKFHIGFYITLASVFIAVASLKHGEKFVLEAQQVFVWAALISFMVAGLAGGVIVSSITQCFGHPNAPLENRCSSSSSFLKQRLGPWEIEMFEGRTWTQIEHTSFWVGAIAAVLAFRRRPSNNDDGSRNASELMIKDSFEIKIGTKP
jgi:hypothetical protein